jgi:hypothetical protein
MQEDHDVAHLSILAGCTTVAELAPCGLKRRAFGGRGYSEQEFKEMVAGYDALFARGDRYALITYTPDGGELPGAKERKRIAEWAESPRVRDLSKKLCVGSATIVENALMREAPHARENVVAKLGTKAFGTAA